MPMGSRFKSYVMCLTLGTVSPSAFPATSLWFTTFGEIFLYVTILQSNYSVYVDGSWRVCFVASLEHECEDLMSPCDGTRVCPVKTSVYTPIRVIGNGVTTHLNSKGKSFLPEAQRKVKPVPLQSGQWAQHTTDWAILSPEGLALR